MNKKTKYTNEDPPRNWFDIIYLTITSYFFMTFAYLLAIMLFLLPEDVSSAFSIFIKVAIGTYAFFGVALGLGSIYYMIKGMVLSKVK